MDSFRAFSVTIVLAVFIVGSQCLDIKVQETYGDHDDGIVGRGGTFSLYCSVPEIRAGKLVVWYKRQGDALPIVLGFNEFLMDPTAKMKFEGKSITTGGDGEEGDLIAFILNMQEGVGVDYMDSGEYGCSISSKLPESGNDPLDDAVWASVDVPDPVDSIHLYSVTADEVHDPEKYYAEYVDGEDIRMVDGEELYFRCVAKGSNPPSVVRVFLGEKELTSQFKEKVDQRTIDSEDHDNSKNNQHFAYDVTMTSERAIRIEREDNKRPFTCNASVPNQKGVQISVLPTMLYRPEIDCHDTISSYREKRAKLQCIVRATPQLTNERYQYNDTMADGKPALQWIKVGETVGQMLFRKEKGDYEDQYVYTLEFTNVPEQSFRKYHFLGQYMFPASHQGENVTGTARLVLDNPGAVMGDGSGASAQRAISLLSLLAIVALFFHL